MAKANNKKAVHLATSDRVSRDITIGSIIVISSVVLFFLIVNDSGSSHAIRFVLAVGCISVLMRPYLRVNSLPMWDNGFGLSFGFGLALSFLLAWIVALTGLIPFATPLCIVTLLILAIAPYIYGRIRKVELYKWTPDLFRRYLWGFAVFLVIFAYAFWVIGFNPVVDNGTENYMDFGFLQAVYRQQLVAPWDIWFAGEKLNYYYLGQSAVVYLCRLAFTTPEYGYNLMLCTFWASVFVMSSEIVYGVIAGICGNDGELDKKGRVASGTGAFVGSMAATFAANGHWLLYGVLTPLAKRIFGTYEGDEYWFPEPTVYISTSLGDVDNGKNEFPAYSAVLGDLHAHVVNVIFVLPLVALVLDYAFSKNKKKNYVNLILCGILLGLYKGSNYWDFAIYFVITGAVVVFCDIKEKGIKRNTIIGIAIKAAIVTILSYVVSLPFTLNFQKMLAGGIELAQYHSPLHKLIILWIVPFVITISFIVWMYKGKDNSKLFGCTKREGLLAFCLCTMGLIITPEFVYVMDIYGIENARFNTMFKLTYQAFILFGIIAGITAGMCLFKSLINKNARSSRVAFILVTAIVIVSAGYTPHAVKDWLGRATDAASRKGISSLEYLYEDPEYYYEMMAYDELSADPDKVVNIIEVAGDSYTHTSALSVLSGTCTVIGWYVHEWMWRNSPEVVGARNEEVRAFYENGDVNYCLGMLQKYDVDYIFVGPKETEKYIVNYEGFEKLGTPVFCEETGDKRYELIKVN